MDFFLNELSYRKPAEDIHEARARMAALITLLLKLKRSTARLTNVPQLRTDETFKSASLGPGYNLAQWRGDPVVDQTQKLLFKSFAAQSPYLKNIPQETTEDFPIVFSYTHEGRECLAFGYAHLLRGFAVSLQTEQCWDTHLIEVLGHFLTQEGEEQSSIEILHASREEHVERNQALVNQRIAEEEQHPSTLSEVWEQRLSLFPHLDFCPRIVEDLARLEPVQHLRGISSALSAYNEYGAQWAATLSSFDHHAMAHVTPENPGRIRDHRGEITFDWGGSPRLFSLHGRFTPGPGRIHMWPDIARRRIVIGYIGMKIGT